LLRTTLTCNSDTEYGMPIDDRHRRASCALKHHEVLYRLAGRLQGGRQAGKAGKARPLISQGRQGERPLPALPALLGPLAGESGYAGVFERRPRPEQCFNCQELGHKAFQCKNAQKCARCAGGGHRHSECTETVLKCVPCGGPHESFSRNCRKLYPSQHE
jgi:hypothetical protein